MSHVCTFRHALALDEVRVKFLPEYANGGDGPSGEGDVKEVWFAGCHSDVYVRLDCPATRQTLSNTIIEVATMLMVSHTLALLCGGYYTKPAFLECDSNFLKIEASGKESKSRIP